MVKFSFPKEYAVSNFMGEQFCEVAVENYYIIKGKIKNCDASDVSKIQDCFYCIEKLSHIVVVFSAMTIESLCNFYMVGCLGNNRFETYDKLNLLEKIDFIFTFIVGNEFKKDTKMYTYLKQLVTERNKLVHNKSKNSIGNLVLDEGSFELDESDLSDRVKKEYKSEMESCAKFSKQSIEAIVLFAKLIDKYDKNANIQEKLFMPEFSKTMYGKEDYKVKVLKEFKIKQED